MFLFTIFKINNLLIFVFQPSLFLWWTFAVAWFVRTSTRSESSRERSTTSTCPPPSRTTSRTKTGDRTTSSSPPKEENKTENVQDKKKTFFEVCPKKWLTPSFDCLRKVRKNFCVFLILFQSGFRFRNKSSFFDNCACMVWTSADLWEKNLKKTFFFLYDQKQWQLISTLRNSSKKLEFQVLLKLNLFPLC